jgi:1,4-alpha-glucan branching enzyme
MNGHIALVLHHHLPYIRHPEHPFFLEERWLYEAITETYLPLISAWRRLEADGVPFIFTASMTPPLVNMLRDDLLKQRYWTHLEGLRALADKEVLRTANDPAAQKVARYYRHHFNAMASLWQAINGDVVGEYRRLMEAGHLEIITCTATHGFLPLMNGDRAAMRAQIEVACAEHARHFGRRPEGIWLAECGYVPGVDTLLKDAGLRYFFVDTHGIQDADAPPVYGVYAPLLCPGTEVAAFARDPESSKQVWSSHEGYPGDASYREYYRDIGFDLPMDYIRPHIHPDGIRLNTGLKYHRITGKTDHKAIYDPETARARAAEHAANFMFNRQAQIRYLRERMDRMPLVVSPYDAELFGHWWYEGPWFIEALARCVHRDQDEIALSSPAEYLRDNPSNQISQPGMSSWGGGGYASFWCNETNDWIYRHLHDAAAAMGALAKRFDAPDATQSRALNQAARELLLAQSSDWAFIMKTGTTVEYAVERTRDHLWAFHQLKADLEAGDIDVNWLSGREEQWRIFPQIDYRVYAG